MSRSRARRAALLFPALAAVLTGCAATGGDARPGRVHHVVICWLKEPGNAAACARLVEASRRLAEIPGVLSVRAGRPIPGTRPVVDATCDVAVIMTFADVDALRRYERHPAHEKATREVLLPLTKKVVVYDFAE